MLAFLLNWVVFPCLKYVLPVIVGLWLLERVCPPFREHFHIGLTPKFVCPFCLAKYSLYKIKFFCKTCQHTETQEGVVQHDPPKPHKNGNDICNGMIERRCPQCNKWIPNEVVYTKNLPFSIIGVSAAGKTNYITVMLHELTNIAGIELALQSANPQTDKIYRDNVNAIYAQHVPPGATQGKPEPQIWTIRNNSKRKSNSVPTYTFTIFDGAGEDHIQLDTADPTTFRYIAESKAIILVVDPLVLENVRKNVDSDVVRNSRGGKDNELQTSDVILDKLVKYIRDARNIAPTALIDVPVAVVFTKFDAILNNQDAFRDYAPIRNNALPIRTDGGVNMEEFREIHENIKKWLYDLDERRFLRKLDSQFREYLFFGVSSYGAPPSNGKLPREIKPHRVLDPMLWLFKKAQFVD